MALRAQPISALVSLPLVVLAGCGGGGGGGSSSFVASAGVDRTAGPFETVELTGSTSSGASPRWRQLSGPPVEFIGPTNSAAVRFVTPQDPGEIVLELAAIEGGQARARDQVRVAVDAPTAPAVTASLRRRILVNGGGAGRATRADHDASTQRVFVLDEVAETVLAFDVSNPDLPVLAGFLLQPELRPGFVPGPPVDVVAEDGVLAVVHEGESRQIPGRVVFYDPLTLVELSSWSTGAGPIDADIADDGSEVVVASAGDLDATALADPRGTVTWIRVPAGGPAAIQPPFDTRTVTFSGYDLLGGELESRGVRLPRSQVEVSRDLEPRAVAFAPDGDIWLSLAANNALARIARPSLLVTDVIGLELADWSEGARGPTSLTGLRPVEWTTGRPRATTSAGQSVPRYDIAAVVDVADGANEDEKIVEIVTARGPVLPRQNVDGDPELELPFALPTSRPELVRLAVSARTGAIEVLSAVGLRTGLGPVTDRPNLRDTAPGLARHDEEPVDLLGGTLALDPFGLHVGGATRLSGRTWIADHYRPSLAVFDGTGLLERRYVPVGSSGGGVNVGTETLPAVYAQRAIGGGFEGVAMSADALGVVAILGAPLDNPDVSDDSNSRASRIVRILDVDRTTGAPRSEFAYVLERAGNVVRDLARSPGGGLSVLELDPLTGHGTVFRVALDGATDLRQLGGAYASVSAALEGTAPEGLGSLAAPVAPVAKSLALDAGGAGYGLTALLGDDGDVEFPLLVTADGHGLGDAVLDPSTGVFSAPSASSATTLALFGARGRELDGSDADGGVQLSNAPVQGLRQALDLEVLVVDGEVLLACADGGLARVLTGVPGYDETTRVGLEVLDPLDFPAATSLQEASALGPLRISAVDGDLDGDSRFDQLVAFGGRSVFLARADGTLAWDSGDSLARRVFARDDARRGRLDAAAPTAGAKPSCLTVAELSGGAVLVVGLENTGNLALFDLSSRRTPRFAGFAPTPVSASPSDLDFVPAADAPAGRAILIAVDRANGALELFDLER